MPDPALSRHSLLGYEVNHAARLLANALRERIESLGVVPGQFAQLLALYETDGLTQAQLCERVEIEQPTMANTLARMQRDGLITRVPDPQDRRRSLVMLTSRARDLEPDLVAAAREVIALATQGLTDQQVETFMTTIATVIANLDKVGIDAGADKEGPP
ncbi:MarR family winged helix-turn-helix transcriptional regulator [Sciscionella marina]|uniref:MarR family winged helix-turn-helix transcriptional regulator n=1 Tax=Sciscionella marina TaxID=508770 RepID=UPI0006843FAF|nr:MarR family transcriptional regulator [Sciscionella marina]